MLLVISITFHCHYNIWGCMCSTGPFQFRWLKGYICSSCYYHHQIGSINLTPRPYPLLSYFPWLCAWDVCCTIFCHLLHIHSRKTGSLFSLSLCSLWWLERVGYAPGEGTPSMLGDMDVPPFWPPFLTFWGLNSIFLGYFFSSTDTKTIFLGC